MAKRRIYDVSPKGSGWTVRERGAQRAVGDFAKKSEAVERASEIGRNQALAQVVIRGSDGRIQSERTYGKDPYPPKG